MALEKEEQTEFGSTYPKRIQMRDGTVRTVNSPEEEAQAHIDDREAA